MSSHSAHCQTQTGPIWVLLHCLPQHFQPHRVLKHIQSYLITWTFTFRRTISLPAIDQQINTLDPPHVCHQPSHLTTPWQVETSQFFDWLWSREFTTWTKHTSHNASGICCFGEPNPDNVFGVIQDPLQCGCSPHPPPVLWKNGRAIHPFPLL